MTGRRVPRPRSSPHTYEADPTLGPDFTGESICMCGSVASASVHRTQPPPRIPPPLLDVAALAAGERPDDDEEDR